jgi:hypothetical protein
MFLNFPCVHALWDGNLGMIWDLKSFNMKEPNVDEKEWAMSFRINTIAMPSISKGVYRQILGKVMDLNYFMDIQLRFGETKMFDTFNPTHFTHPFIAHVVG